MGALDGPKVNPSLVGLFDGVLDGLADGSLVGTFDGVEVVGTVEGA